MLSPFLKFQVVKDEACEEEANEPKACPTDQVRAYTLQATCAKISLISKVSYSEFYR